jgi:thiol:disulfide interchange protein
MSARTLWASLALLAAIAALAGCPKPTAPPTDATRATQPAQAKDRAAAPADEAAKPAVDAAPDGIAWEPTYAQALDKAKADNKPLMMDLYADWCGPCRKLDTETWGDPKVREAASGFVCVKVNVDNDQATAEKYGANAIPLVVFLKPDGTESDRSVGFVNAAEMLKLMNKALGK